MAHGPREKHRPHDDAFARLVSCGQHEKVRSVFRTASLPLQARIHGSASASAGGRHHQVRHAACDTCRCAGNGRRWTHGWPACRKLSIRSTSTSTFRPASNELVQWGNDGLGVHDAKQRAQQGKGDPNEANARVYKFWSTDMLFNHLLNVDVPLDLKTFNPGPGPRSKPAQSERNPVRPTMLTNVVFGMCKEVLGQNSAYLRAECALMKRRGRSRPRPISCAARSKAIRPSWPRPGTAGTTLPPPGSFWNAPAVPRRSGERLSQFHAQYPMRFGPRTCCKSGRCRAP